VQAYDADLTTWAGITPGANVGTFLATPSGANLASALTSALPVGAGGTGVSTSGTTSQIAVGGGTGSAIVWTTATGTGAPVRATSPTITTPVLTNPTMSLISSNSLTQSGAGYTGYVINSTGSGDPYVTLQISSVDKIAFSSSRADGFSYISHAAVNRLKLTTTGATLYGNTIIGTAGTAITNIRHGVSGAMVLGVVTVTDTGCTANTRYFFTTATLGTITAPSTYWASTRTASTSFVITSNQLTETGTVHWLAIEP
jgi:hypothetical protein